MKVFSSIGIIFLASALNSGFISEKGFRGTVTDYDNRRHNIGPYLLTLCAGEIGCKLEVINWEKGEKLAENEGTYRKPNALESLLGVFFGYFNQDLHVNVEYQCEDQGWLITKKTRKSALINGSGVLILDCEDSGDSKLWRCGRWALKKSLENGGTIIKIFTSVATFAGYCSIQ